MARHGAISGVPDQLDELKRQRALVAEHLAWLDRQIATATTTTESERSPGPSAPPPQAPSPASEMAPSTQPLADNTEAEALFAQFTAEEAPALRPPSKSGCWVIFSVMLLLLVGGAIAVIYSAYR